MYAMELTLPILPDSKSRSGDFCEGEGGAFDAAVSGKTDGQMFHNQAQRTVRMRPSCRGRRQPRLKTAIAPDPDNPCFAVPWRKPVTSLLRLCCKLDKSCLTITRQEGSCFRLTDLFP